MLIELIYRGYTHWTMGVVGGVCFILVGAINEFIPWSMCLLSQMCYGGVIITAVEFVAGLILNVWLGLNIWDYSNMSLNVMGQICVPYALMWVGLSGIAIVLDDVIRWKFFNEEKPHYKFL